MHPVFSIEILLCIVISSLLSGCIKVSEEPAVSFTLGDWIMDLCREAGIYEYDSQVPYFDTCSPGSEYYESVQAAVEWGVLDPELPFHPEESLTRRWIAYTVYTLNGEENVRNSVEILDEEDPVFRKAEEWICTSGLMCADDGMFHPENNAGYEEAEEILEHALQIINSRSFETKNEFQADAAEIEPVYFDQQNMIAVIKDDLNIEAGDLVKLNDEEGIEQIYKISSAENSADGRKLQLEAVSPEDLSSFEIQGEFEADFSNAGICSDYETSAVSKIHLTAAESLQKTFNVKGYKITLSATSTSLKADVYRPLSNGAEIYADLILSKLKASYHFKQDGDTADNSYFKISYTSAESLGIRRSEYNRLYGDTSAIKSSDFLNSLMNIWQKTKISEEDAFEICTIELPVPNAPALTLKLTLNLNISATGKAELSLSQNNVLGAETRNGKIRLIKDVSYSRQAAIKATAGITAGMKFTLCMLSRSLSDLNIKAGAKAKVAGKLHLYDEEGNMSTQDVEAYDLAEEMSDGNPDILVCSDITAYWLLNLSINGSSSILGKLGMGREWSILNEKNAPLLSVLAGHYENGVRVAQCTRSSRTVLPSSDNLKISDSLMISEYSVIMSVDEEKVIAVTALPEGYSKNELIYTSTNEDTAEVSSSGVIKAVYPGNAEIVISTNDGKYKVQCSVLVAKAA